MDTEVIKIDKLQEASQFTSWKFQVRITLIAKEIFNVVSGTEVKPSPATDEASGSEKEAALKSIAEWIKKDARAQSIIVGALSAKTVVHVMGCETSSDMWTKLISIFEQTDEIAKSQLQQKFFSFKKDTRDDMATHFSKMELLVHQMNGMQLAVDDTMVMTKLLMTLPSEYRHFVSAWESTQKNMQTLTNLKSRWLIEEGRFNVEPETGDALFMKKGASRKKQNQKSKDKKKGGCFRCGSTSHWKKDCKEPDSSKETKSKGEKEPSKLFFSNSSMNTEIGDVWFSDSGATDHMQPGTLL